MTALPCAAELAKRYSGFLFDLDGTLLDSMHAWVEADKSFLGRRGFEVTPDYTEFVKTNSAERSAVYTIERFNLDMTIEEVIKEWLDFVKDEYAHHIKLKEGAGEFLRQASEAGIRLGAATAQPTCCHYGSPSALEPVLRNKRSHCSEKPTHRNWRVAPIHCS